MLAAQPLAGTQKIYEITLEDITGGGRFLALAFYRTPPLPEFVDKLLHNALEVASIVEPTKDILATGFVGEDTMTSDQYSGSLIYRADVKKIMTMDEYLGVKKAAETRARCHLGVEEEKTLEGIKPERRWLSVSLVYPAQPDRAVAYEDMLTVAKEMAPKGLDVNMYVFVGDKDKNTSWEQVRDSDGAYMFCEYNAKTRKVLRKEAVLGVIAE
jgi:hypothetical protein